jgi:hypothetical protein
MSKKTVHPKTALRTRQTAYRRKVRSIQRRQGNKRTRPDPPRVLANSIFALTLDAKPGLEVLTITAGKKSLLQGEDDYFRIYSDLFPVMKHAVKLATGEHTEYDPLLDGQTIGWSLGYLVRIFKTQVLPKDYEFRIDKSDQHGYHFTIYRYCPFNDFWHAFEVKPVIEDLKKTNCRLHDLFISFLNYFLEKTGIDAWWNGALGYAEYALEEEVFNWEDNVGPIAAPKKASKQEKKEAEQSRVQYEQANLAIKEYKTGDPVKYKKLILSNRVSKTAILSALAHTKVNHPIVNWMLRAMDFMEAPGSIREYMYRDYFDDENIEGLMFDEQVALLWDWQDPYSRLQGEGLDANAQGVGIHPPLLHYPITLDTKKIDVAQLNERVRWPAKLSDLWNGYATIVENKLKKKKK